MIHKNRNREQFSFANINLLGNCNAKCYFCLGKDIPEYFGLHNQLSVHFSKWKNFELFLNTLKIHSVKKVYITGQNTDSLLYRYLKELILYLQDVHGFSVGLRTNGYLFNDNEDMINIANLCDDEIGVSVQSLNVESNKKILGRSWIPNWDFILPKIKNLRVSIVVNRYNNQEFFSILKYLSKFDNIRYIQARRISTDTRFNELKEDIELYEDLYDSVRKDFKKLRDFYTAEIYEMYGKEVCFWRTVETSVNSLNYFTDGVFNDEYFVIEGYLKSIGES